MASLAETIGAQANPTVDLAGSLGEGIKAGIQLATAKEDVEAKKAQTEALKADLMIKQAGTANSLLTNLARANPMIAKKMLPQIREKLINLGVSPDVADYTISDDANRQRQIAFSQMAGNKLTSDPKMAQQYFNSLADIVGYDAAAQAFDNQLKRNQQDKQMAQQDRQFYAELNQKKSEAASSSGLSIGQKEMDKDFAKQLNDWESSGRSQVDKNLERLKEAKAKLEKDSSLTGAVRGNVPDVVRNLTNEEAIKVRDDVRAAAQGALKATLGAQFTEREGADIMNRSYNEKLSPQANIEKIQAAIDELEANKNILDQKTDYFRQNRGTLANFQPSGAAKKNETAGLDLEAKRQQAIDAGYSPEEVDAYIQSLKTVKKVKDQ